MTATDNQPTLGELIEEQRLALGLTKSEAARRAGVSRGTWHEVETGKRVNMLADTLNLFDKALGYERGTLRRQASRSPGDMNPAAPRTPVPVFISHSASDEYLAERMQLIRQAMTMTGDDVRMILLMISSRENSQLGGDFREELRQLVRAVVNQLENEGVAGDPEPGRANGGRTASREGPTPRAH